MNPVKLWVRFYNWFLSLFASRPLWDEEDEAALEAYRNLPDPKPPYARPGRWRSGL